MMFSLRARVVFPVDRPPIENGVVTIDGERIVAVGTRAAGGEVSDLGSMALLPGLVNAHTHLEFSNLRKPLGQPGMALVDWIRLVIAERGVKAAPNATAAGLAESLRCGVTTIGEIAASSTTDFPTVAVDMTAFAEVIGFSRARAGSAFAAVVERLDQRGSRSNVHLGISPHAPYTVSPELLSQLIGAANSRDLPVAMHLAESPEELDFLATGAGPFQQLLEERSMWDAAAVPRGSTPLDYLRLLAEAPRALVIHGNYLDAEEPAFLAAHADRMSLVFCPRTHGYFRHAPYPLAELLAAGVRVALGTDSRASNPDLDLLAEMRHVARKTATVEPAAILRMGTLSGAEALGRSADLGSITPGKLANLAAIPLRENGTGTADDLLHSLLAGETAVQSVWLRGRKMH